jgi:hypothetical protein
VRGDGASGVSKGGDEPGIGQASGVHVHSRREVEPRFAQRPLHLTRLNGRLVRPAGPAAEPVGKLAAVREAAVTLTSCER